MTNWKGDKMNKAELIDAIANSCGKLKSDVSCIFDEFLKQMTIALKNGEQISLTGYFSVAVANLAEREGRNPKTGEKISIPARKTAKFKVGKYLKDAIA